MGYDYASRAVRKFDSERVVSPPEHATLPTIVARDLQHEFIRDGISPYTCNLAPPVRKVAQDARTGQSAFRVMDYGGKIPVNPKVPSPLALHPRIPVIGPSVL
jgi:hypothetical protein